ncbi:MAG: 2-dehydropantoate 2-reductase [Proteobacteria bacterium]|nr:2-dehydropantoate 2-reductase [Pseudomonadota bacterium]
MRILVVGAGAIGGYFGGRLLQANRDVTFLVRERRAAQLRETGLVIRSPLGDLHVPGPPVVQSSQLRQPFDLILLSCKAYDLGSAIDSFAPAVGPGTTVLPLLNGMKHLDALDARFGADAVLGGLCLISTALDKDGRILHLNHSHGLTFGERSGRRTERAEAIFAQINGAPFDGRLSDHILQSMWEKWAFIAAAAGITCLMRASVGDILEAGGTESAKLIYEECAQIAADNGFPPGNQSRQISLSTMTAAGSPLTASMLRDIESHGRTEVDQILGDLLLRRKAPATGPSLLAMAHLHVEAYEARRRREQHP